MILSHKLLIIKQKGTQSLYKYSGLLKCTPIVLLSSACIVQAEEIAPFKVTDVGGSLSLKFLSNNQDYISQGVTTQKTENQRWQEELSLDMKSYVYHPNFLTMNFGAGFLSDQSTFDSSDYSYKTKQRVTNLSAKLNFLSKRATPFSLHYKQTNTTTPGGLSGSYLLEHVSYGANLALLTPLTPVAITLSALRETNYGKGADQITDSIHERIKLNMSYSYGVSSYVKMGLQNNNRISRSGSLNLAIDEKESSTSLTTINTKNNFGSNRQIRLESRANYYKQDEFPGRESWFFGPNLNWKHNDNFASYYTYSTSHSDEQDIESENNKTTARLNYTGDNSFNAGINLSLSNNESTVFESEDKSFSFSVRKKIDASYGKYTLSYNAGINTHEQRSTSGLLPIFGDEYILAGVTQVTITRENIDTSTIIVSNITRTQTFVEGLDYSITVIGDQTLIERLIAGNIADGQSILIDYSYQTGGTTKHDQLTQRLNIDLAIGKFYNLQAGFYQTKQKLKEGLPSIALDSSDGIILSLRAKRPLKNGIKVGGKILAQQHNEDSNPYNKQSISAFTSLPLFAKATLGLNAGLLKQDNENSDNDINNKTLGMHIGGSPWAGVSMSFDSQYSQDTGSPTKRTRLTNNLGFNWHYRKLSYKATIGHRSEEQGTTERNNWSIYMKLTRAF